MGSRNDFDHVGDLVQKCADTMRLISRKKNESLRDCPFRHVVLELENLSEEIKDIAASLPAAWDEQRG